MFELSTPWRSVLLGGLGIEEQEALGWLFEDDPNLSPEDPEFIFSNCNALSLADDIVTLLSTFYSVSLKFGII